MATDAAQTLINTPVVFLPAATVDAVLASSDRIGALRAQVDVADTSVVVGTDENPLRLRIHLFSHVPVDVDRVGDIGTNHGYLSGQPVVPTSDGSGPQPAPSADVTKDANAVGNTTIDWLDTAPDGYVAYGVWTFDQYAGLGSIRFHGVTCAIPLVLRGTGVALTVSAVVDSLNHNATTGVYFGPADSPPSVDDAQSTTDAATGQVSDMASFAASDGATYTAAITAVSWDMTDDQDTDQPYTDVFCRLSWTPPTA